MEVETKQEKKGLFFGWWIVVTGFLLMTFAYPAFVTTTGVFIIPVTESLGITRTEFNLILTITGILTIVLIPIMGKVFEKTAHFKMIMAISAIISCLGLLGFAMATRIWHFYVCAVFLAVGYSNITVLPISILVNNWFGGKAKGTAMGIAFMGSGVGGFILNPLLNYVISVYSWRTGYLVEMATFIVILIPAILLFVVKKPEEKGLMPLGAIQTAEASDGKKGMLFKEARRTPIFWIMVFSLILLTFGSSSLIANGIPYFIQIGLTPETAASYFGIALGFLILGKPIVGMLCDKLGVRNGSVISIACFAAAFLVLFLLPGNKYFMYLFILLFGIGVASATVCPPLLTGGLFGQKDYGTIVGIATMAVSIGGAFGGTVAAKVYDATGTYQMFWLIIAIALLASSSLIYLCFSLAKRYKQA